METETFYWVITIMFGLNLLFTFGVWFDANKNTDAVHGQLKFIAQRVRDYDL